MKTIKKHKKIKYGWVMYRTNSSSGNGDWIYREVQLPFDKDAKDLLKEEIDEKYNYSEHYRGCDIKLIKSPPRSFLNELAESCNDKVKRYQEMENRYLLLAFKAPAKIKFYYTTDQRVSPSWIIESINFPENVKNPWGHTWKTIRANDIEEARKLIEEKIKTGEKK